MSVPSALESKTESPPTCLLRIYMKSGNVIVLPHVTDLTYQMHGIRKLTLGQSAKVGGEVLFVPGIDVDQIEAITSEYTE